MSAPSGNVIQGKFHSTGAVQALARNATRRVAVMQAANAPGRSVQRSTNSTQAIPLSPGMAAFGQRTEQLPAVVRAKMESYFKMDFGHVRIHVGPEATRIGALAFTQGSDIYFAPGQYNPSTPQGQQLLGHELTHVQQQRNGRVRNPFGSGTAIVQDPTLEAEAERHGRMAAVHHPVQCSPASLPSPLGSVPLGKEHVRIHAGTPETSRGSVDVRSAGRSAIEVTDLHVAAEHRRQGLGQALLSSAMHAGLRMGKQTMRLSAEDNGSGRLTAWYKSLGFRPVGRDDRGLIRMEAPLRSALTRAVQPSMQPGRTIEQQWPFVYSVLQPASSKKRRQAEPTLTEMADTVYAQLPRGRGASCTTIAFARTTDGGLFCTSNDVNSIPTKANTTAKNYGAAGGVVQAGAGFHAEMWMLIEAFTQNDTPKNVKNRISSVGASRKCCKYCTAVLKKVGITMEAPSEDLYGSWMNPLTTEADGKPRANYATYQDPNIPDYRVRSTNYWFTDKTGKVATDPPGQ